MDLIRGGAAAAVAGLVALLIVLPQWLLGAESPGAVPVPSTPSTPHADAPVVPTTDAPEELSRVAGLFVDFAAGKRPRPPAGGHVDLYVGGVHQRRLESVDLRL